MIERRNEQRTPVNKQGVALVNNNVLYLINVENRSKHGLGFSTRNTMFYDINIGDFVKIKYENNDLLVKIARKNKNNFGCVLV